MTLWLRRIRCWAFHERKHGYHECTTTGSCNNWWWCDECLWGCWGGTFIRREQNA